MSGRVAPAVGMVLVVMALAGCAAPQEAANPLEKAFGAGNISTNAGNPIITGNVLQGDAGAGWTVFPNATIMAPKITQTDKGRPAFPGGGVTTALAAPATGTPLKLRVAPGIDTTGVMVSFAVKDPAGDQGVWSTPAPATEEAALNLLGIGSYEVLAKFDVGGIVAETETPLAVNLNIVWTIESEVWPLAPSAEAGTGTCTPGSGPVFACAYVGTHGGGVFACGPDPVACQGQGTPGLPGDVPDTPRPPNYEEMADVFPFTIPSMDARIEINSEFRGDYSPDQGTNVDLELMGSGSPSPDGPKSHGYGMCISNGGQPAADGLPPTPDPQDANEQFQMHPMPAGAMVLRIGAASSCPWLAYYNVGMVPYQATVTLIFGIPVPKCNSGGLPGMTDSPPEPKPTQAAGPEEPGVRPIGPGCMPPDVMEKRPPGLA